MKGPLGMALALRPQSWVSPSLGAVMDRGRGPKRGEPGQWATWGQRVIQAADLGVPLCCAQSPAGQ